MRDTDKIATAKLRIKYTIEAIDSMIIEEQKNMDKYKTIYVEETDNENIYYTLELNISRNIINLKSIRQRLTDTLNDLEVTEGD